MDFVKKTMKSVNTLTAEPVWVVQLLIVFCAIFCTEVLFDHLVATLQVFN